MLGKTMKMTTNPITKDESSGRVTQTGPPGELVWRG